jgi:hypothetical protein
VINEGDWPGQLLSFVLDSDGEHWRGIKAIPRINSQGQLFGAVYKVASEQQLKTEDSGGPAVTVERMQYIEEGAH